MATTAGRDLPTLVAIAVVAFALANVAHEGLGHGGACLIGGSRPLVLSSVHFECDEGLLSDAGRRLLAAGGTVVNVVVGGLAALAFRTVRRGPHLRWFLWLLASVNLFQAAGYLLFSGLGDVGDWAEVIAGRQPSWAWHAGLAVGGAAAYVGIARTAARGLAPLLRDDARVAHTRQLAVPSYWSGGVLYCVSSLLNPLGPSLLLISAAAASLGGASGLLWFHEFLRGDSGPAAPDAIMVTRHTAWLAAGAVTAAVFIGVLGPGVRLATLFGP